MDDEEFFSKLTEDIHNILKNDKKEIFNSIFNDMVNNSGSINKKEFISEVERFIRHYFQLKDIKEVEDISHINSDMFIDLSYDDPGNVNILYGHVYNEDNEKLYVLRLDFTEYYFHKPFSLKDIYLFSLLQQYLKLWKEDFNHSSLLMFFKILDFLDVDDLFDMSDNIKSLFMRYKNILNNIFLSGWKSSDL